MNAMLIAFMPFAAVFVVFLVSFLVARGKACPACGKPLPVLQSPITKSWRQWVEGGYAAVTVAAKPTWRA